MRADRLVATLLLLQQRGQVTAAEIATELEVSERTARRDLDALGLAGIPVYSVQGRHGGWRLAGGGKTDLSGLTAAEVRALFLVAGPSSLVAPGVKAALRKLMRALPEPLRDGAEAAATAVLVDPSGWDRSTTSRRPAQLEAVEHAVIEGFQVRLGYVARDRTPSERVVHPLGLVAKGSVWYLVADTDAGLRTFRVDRVASVDSTGDKVVKPSGFDLHQAWRLIADDIDRMRTPITARAVAASTILRPLGMTFGTRLGIGPAGEDGRVEVELRGHSVRSLAGELARFGAELEVLDPPDLREELAGIGHQMVSLYR